MDALLIPVTSSPLAAALNALSDAAFAQAQDGAIPQDLFAALLAQQLGGLSGSPEGQDDVLLEQDAAYAEDADPGLIVDPLAVDAAIQAQQQAVLGLPGVLVPSVGVVRSDAASDVAAVQVALAGIAPPAKTQWGGEPVAETVDQEAAADPRLVPVTMIGGRASAGVVGEVDAAMASGIAAENAARSPFQRQLVAADSAAFAAAAPMIVEAGGSKSAQSPLPEVSPGVAAPSALPLPSVAPAATPATQAVDVIPQPVASPAWGGVLGEKVVWMVGQQQQSAEIHLNPPALGPLEVRVSMSDGQATLTFTTQHLPVREALEAATPRLREMLGESGISLGGVSVNVGSFSQQAQGEQPGNPRQGPAFSERAGVANQFTTVLPGAGGGRATNGMVDLFA